MQVLTQIPASADPRRQPATVTGFLPLNTGGLDGVPGAPGFSLACCRHLGSEPAGGSSRLVSFSQTKKVDETQPHVLEKDEDSDPESSGVAPAPSAVAALAGLHPPTPGGHPAPDTAWKGCQLSVQVTQATGAVTIGQGLALPSLLAVRPTTAMGPAHSGGQEQAKSSVGAHAHAEARLMAPRQPDRSAGGTRRQAQGK